MTGLSSDTILKQVRDPKNGLECNVIGSPAQRHYCFTRVQIEALLDSFRHVPPKPKPEKPPEPPRKMLVKSRL